MQNFPLFSLTTLLTFDIKIKENLLYEFEVCVPTTKKSCIPNDIETFAKGQNNIIKSHTYIYIYIYIDNVRNS